VFSILILNPKEVLYEGEAESVFLQGDEGEFEVLEYHSPIMSNLRKGKIVIDGRKYLAIKGGIARFDHNSLVVLAE